MPENYENTVRAASFTSVFNLLLFRPHHAGADALAASRAPMLYADRAITTLLTLTLERVASKTSREKRAL
jgi:hypothetical protein